MLNRIVLLIAALALAVPLYPQDKGTEKQEKKPADKMTIWQEVVLEDFETTPFSNKDVTFSLSSDQEAGLSIRTDLPATAGSKKYLGIKVKTRGSDTFTIKPPKEIVIEKYCKSLSFWVYGEKTYGELSIMLKDTNEISHRLIIVPVVDFVGWKQFTVLLTKTVNQGSGFQNQKKIMKITGIQYRTTPSTGKPSRWEYLYLDDITATLREDSGGKQNDQW